MASRYRACQFSLSLFAFVDRVGVRLNQLPMKVKTSLLPLVSLEWWHWSLC